MFLIWVCLLLAMTKETMTADVKPIYQVVSSDGVVGNYTPESEENFFQIDCTNCFPKARLLSMQIWDSSGKCGSHIVGDTSPKEHKNKNVAIVYCSPCDDYDLKVIAKVERGGLPGKVTQEIKYNKEACPILTTTEETTSTTEKSGGAHLSLLSATIVILAISLKFSLMLLFLD